MIISNIFLPYSLAIIDMLTPKFMIQKALCFELEPNLVGCPIGVYCYFAYLFCDMDSFSLLEAMNVTQIELQVISVRCI